MTLYQKVINSVMSSWIVLYYRDIGVPNTNISPFILITRNIKKKEFKLSAERYFFAGFTNKKLFKVGNPWTLFPFPWPRQFDLFS